MNGCTAILIHFPSISIPFFIRFVSFNLKFLIFFNFQLGCDLNHSMSALLYPQARIITAAGATIRKKLLLLIFLSLTVQLRTYRHPNKFIFFIFICFYIHTIFTFTYMNSLYFCFCCCCCLPACRLYSPKKEEKKMRKERTKKTTTFL